MSRGKKTIIAIFIILDLIVFGVVFYGMRVTKDASNMVASIHESVDRKNSKQTNVSIDDTEPFSVLLLGVDTGDLGRTEQGRSDTMMMVTVNPKEKKSTVLSLERDILTKIVGYGTSDKLNHAYAYGGVEMTMDTVENLLDTPVNHYVTINMKGLKDLIDAVGGITVDNKIDFELDGVHVKKGKQKLNGTKGLAYARMRKEDPDGDIGRQKRQREVVQKIMDKILSIDGASNYKKLLKAVEKNMKTDLDWDDMLDIARNYTPALENVKNDQLQGENQMIDGVYYQILGTKELLEKQNMLKEQLDLKTSKTLPNLKDPDEAYNFIDDSEDSTGSDGAEDTQNDYNSYNDGTQNGYGEQTDTFNNQEQSGTYNNQEQYQESDPNYTDQQGGYSDNGYTDDGAYQQGY